MSWVSSNMHKCSIFQMRSWAGYEKQASILQHANKQTLPRRLQRSFTRNIRTKSITRNSRNIWAGEILYQRFWFWSVFLDVWPFFFSKSMTLWYTSLVCKATRLLFSECVWREVNVTLCIILHSRYLNVNCNYMCVFTFVPPSQVHWESNAQNVIQINHFV